jgi:hypothetical protein
MHVKILFEGKMCTTGLITCSATRTIAAAALRVGAPVHAGATHKFDALYRFAANDCIAFDNPSRR